MEAGRLYKSNMGELVVFCIKVIDDECFYGVVIDSGNSGLNIGFVSYEGNHFLQKSFEEYAPTQAPEDECNATVNGSAERFKEITAEMTATFIAKNKDYGNSFDKTIDEEGYVAFQVRALDKLNRFKSILSSQSREVKDESILDTLKDLANYCIMCSMKISEDLDNKKEVKYYERI